MPVSPWRFVCRTESTGRANPDTDRDEPNAAAHGSSRSRPLQAGTISGFALPKMSHHHKPGSLYSSPSRTFAVNYGWKMNLRRQGTASTGAAARSAAGNRSDARMRGVDPDPQGGRPCGLPDLNRDPSKAGSRRRQSGGPRAPEAGSRITIKIGIMKANPWSGSSGGLLSRPAGANYGWQ